MLISLRTLLNVYYNIVCLIFFLFFFPEKLSVKMISFDI